MDDVGGRGFRRYSKVVWPGFSNTPSPRHVSKVGRNDACPCGSGKKYKDCHAAEGSAYLEKLAREDDRKRAKELRQRLKEAGVPWYRRIFFRA
jgi:hypothetical protein